MHGLCPAYFWPPCMHGLRPEYAGSLLLVYIDTNLKYGTFTRFGVDSVLTSAGIREQPVFAWLPSFVFKLVRLTYLKLKAIFELKIVATTRRVANLDRSRTSPFTLGPNPSALAIWLYTGLTASQHLRIHRLRLLYTVKIIEETFAVGAFWSSRNS